MNTRVKAKRTGQREQQRGQQQNRLRGLRVIDYLDYFQVFENSPIEVREGYTVSDMDTGELFACFIFANVSVRDIKELKIKMYCYKNQNIPYLKLFYTYSADNYNFGIRIKKGEVKDDFKFRDKRDPFISTGETFGATTLVPLPDTYFTKFVLEINSVTYSNGITEELELTAGKAYRRINELSSEEKAFISRSTVKAIHSEKYPAVVLPQKGSSAWLCCCGYKNPVSCVSCECCRREMEWQFEHLSDEALEAGKQRIMREYDSTFKFDKSAYQANTLIENKEDKEKKMRQYDQALKNVEKQERERGRRQASIIPKVLLWFAAMGLIIFILELFIYFSSTTGGAG